MKMYKKIIALIAMLFGMTGWAGDSAPFLLDTTDPLVETDVDISFSYNSSWIGGNSSAEVVISADGTEIKRTTGEGEFAWAPTKPGKHTLTYTTYIDGVQQDEVYTATVFKDWKYTLEAGKATIIATMQTSGDVIIPSEIDGYPVVGLGDGVFTGCENLTCITISDSVYSLGANTFANCRGLTKISMPLPLKAQVEAGNVFAGCNENLKIVYRSAEIKNIVAKQRYPWNGKVDIYFDVVGNVLAGLPDSASVGLLISAKDRVTGEEWVAEKVSGDTGINEGRHHITWDMKTDGYELNSNDVIFTVSYGIENTLLSDEIICEGECDSVSIDTKVVTESLFNTQKDKIFYNSSWIGGNSSAVIVIADNGTEIYRGSGEGDFVWAPTTVGRHTLTYTTYINGVVQDEVYTATVFKDWKYTVADGKATIVDTTQKSGSVTIPSEIDGLPVVGFDTTVFANCTNLTSITIPDSVDSVNGFENRLLYQLVQNAWALQGIESNNEVLTYKSNDIGDSASTYMAVVIEGPLEFSFNWKVSSESGYDKLKWYLNGTQNSEISGTGNDWQTVTCSIPAGEHIIKWEYSKDGSVDSGEDCGWVRLPYLEESVVSCFNGCMNLSQVAMPGNLVTRMSEIFPDSYEKLTCVTLIGDIAEISDNFFKDCASLEEIKFSGEIAHVGKNAFDGCSSLDITTQNGFRLYKGWCLEYVGADTTTLNIPNGVIGIADGAFEGKTSLKKVTFPDSLRFIGADAFAGCTQLAELSLTDGIVEIGDGAFRDCTWVQNIKMPTTLERIGAAAFANCAYLPDVVCADGLKEIGAEAFSNCWRMTSVSLPASLDAVGRDAFWNCKNLGGVTVPAHVQPLAMMFPASYSALTDIGIAEGETELCEGVFEGCAGVSKIDIPEVVTDIPARAFKNCTSFDRVSLPAGLLTIGDEAFAGCSKVGSLTLPESLTSIGAVAFNGWGLLDVVTIPDGVTFIGSGAFAGCTAVRQVRMPSNVATVSSTFPNAYSQIVRVTVPEDSTSIISGFLNGCTSITSFDIPLSVTEIGENAFRGCNNLSGITLPDGLKTIGSYAFYGCSLISNLSIPSSVTSIGSNAFGSCAQIRSVVISGDSGTLSSLSPDAYQQIVTVTILSGSERLMDRIFAGCTSLKNVDIPASVTEIGESAFENCTTLTSVGIPSGVTVLSKGAFRGCASLAEITLPNGLAVLEDEVFSGCSHLTAITVPESVVEIGSKVFNGCTLLYSVKFVGDAPVVKSDTYGGASSSLATSVPYASMGWDGVETSMALPEYWPAGTAHSILWWNPIRFDVTFDWNYENGETDLIEQVVDTTYQLPEVDPTREGAVFAGWWTAKTDGARITPVSRVMLTTPHTLYAHWRMNEYSVAFDANGGVGTMETMSLTVNEAKTLRLCEFTRLDCDFAGWAMEPEGEVVYRDGAEVVNLTLEHGDTVTLYAIWTPRTWTAGDYLNQTKLTFTGEGDALWVPDAEISHDGIGSLRSGAIGASEFPNRTYSTVKATVVGEGTGSFWWKVHCEETEDGDWFDYAVFTIDGVEIAKIAGDTDWTKVVYSVTGAGKHELAWTFTRDDYDMEDVEWQNAAWLDELVWSPKMVTLNFASGGATGDLPEAIVRQEGVSVILPDVGNLVKGTDIFKGWSDGTTLHAPGTEYTFGSADVTLTAVWEVKVWTLAEAADAEALIMTTGGNSDWTIDATTGYTNTMSVKSGVVSSGQESWIETKVNGSGTLTFRWKVMGGIYRNKPFAYAKVEVDGSELASEYLTDGWEDVSLAIEGNKEHIIRWTYLRTSSRDADGDCAWIDAVVWTPAVTSDVMVDVGGGKRVAVPAEWIDKYDSIVTATGGDKVAALMRTAANGRKVWECFMLGVDPTKADDDFKITRFWMEDGVPKFEFSHSADGSGNSFMPRIKPLGKAKLSDSWQDVPVGGDASFRFFTVEVELP